MAEVLSQQEIDRLLTGINSGEIKEDDISSVLDKKEIIEYDFRRPTRISKDQLKTFRNLHENFSELFGFYLASRLQTMATVDLLSVDQLRYSEYVLSIANPCVVFIFDIDENGKAVIEMTPDLVFMIVERLLGGNGGQAESPRNITTIEQRIIEPLIIMALEKLANAWRPVHNMNYKLTGFESNSDFVQIAPASEIVIIISFEIKVGEETYLMNICYPSFALEDVIARLNVQYHTNNITQQNKELSYSKITKQLQNTKMVVKSVLGSTKITVKELMDLEVDDVLYLNTQINDDIPVFVQNRLKYYGRPGTVDGHNSVKITREIEKCTLIGDKDNG